MRYGDILQYPDLEDPDHDWLFMYLGESIHIPFRSVVVVKSPAVPGEYVGDAWMPGYVTIASKNELEAVAR